MTECSISLPWPPTVNSSHKTFNGKRLAERTRKWRDEAGWMLKQQRPHKFKGEVEIVIYLRPPDRRRRDGDNIEKALNDLLKAHRVIKDDSLDIIGDSRRVRVDDINAPECCVVIRDRQVGIEGEVS